MKNSNFFEMIMNKILSAQQDQVAYVDVKKNQYTYFDLKQKIQSYQSALLELNLNQYTDVIFVVPAGADLIAALIACFSINKTVVFIDPKLGIKNFYKIASKINSAVVVYYKMNTIVWFLKLIFKNLQFLPLKLSNVVGDLKLSSVDATNPWLIDGFTSGSTGEIKRIRRTHTQMIKSAEIFTKNIIQLKLDQHMIGYTLSALRNLIDQGTAFELPKNKKNIHKFVHDNKINRISGPPVVSYLTAAAFLNVGEINTLVKNIIMGGAPVQHWLLKMLKQVFPEAIIQNIYGCTECEPISHCTADEMLNYAGLGYFVGRPVPELKCEYELVDSDLYELIVHGEHVTKVDGHRTGDLVRKLTDGKIALVGRKIFLLTNDAGVRLGQYEVETLIENKFELIKKVAVIQKKSILYIYIELFKFQNNNAEIEKFCDLEIQKLGFNNFKIIFTIKLPYDRRHQWKVQYHQL